MLRTGVGRLAQRVGVAQQRFYTTTRYVRAEEKAVALPSITPPKEVIVTQKRGLSWGQRLATLSFGAVLGGGYGLYEIQNQIWQSTRELEDAINSLKTDSIDAIDQLRKKVTKLEKELSDAKSKK